MKKISFLVLSLLVVLSVTATDKLYIENFNIGAGETKTISVMLTNSSQFAGFQFDVQLPSGLTVTGCSKSSRASKHTISTNTLSDGTYRVWISSSASRLISGTSGALVALTVKAGNSFSGTKKLWLRNIIGAVETTDAGGQRVKLPDCVCLINPGNYILGDLNGDGIVDVSDVNIMIDMVLGKQEVNLSTADLNDDGKIDVSDVNKLIDIVLGKD